MQVIYVKCILFNRYNIITIQTKYNRLFCRPLGNIIMLVSLVQIVVFKCHFTKFTIKGIYRRVRINTQSQRVGCWVPSKTKRTDFRFV